MSPPKRRIDPLILIVSAIFFFAFLNAYYSLPGSEATIARPPPGTVTHVVLFQWKTSADPDAIVAATKRMKALKGECVRADGGEPYILSMRGGRDNSIEDLQNGATHGFVVEFASVADRDYYVKTDPAHGAFVKSIGSIVEKVTVVDFADDGPL